MTEPNEFFNPADFYKPTTAVEQMKRVMREYSDRCGQFPMVWKFQGSGVDFGDNPSPPASIIMVSMDFGTGELYVSDLNGNRCPFLLKSDDQLPTA